MYPLLKQNPHILVKSCSDVGWDHDVLGENDNNKKEHGNQNPHYTEVKEPIIQRDSRVARNTLHGSASRTGCEAFYLSAAESSEEAVAALERNVPSKKP